MKLEDQVTSLELSLKLSELGVKQESYFYWYKFDKESIPEDQMKYYISDKNKYLFQLDPYIISENWAIDKFSAYSSSELSEIIPKVVLEDCYLVISLCDEEWCVRYKEVFCYINIYKELDKKLCDAMAKMIIYLIEHQLISVDEINKGIE